MNMLKISLLLSVAFYFSAGQADVIGNSSGDSGGGSSASEEITKACEASYIARLSLASMYGNCDAPSAAKGGGVPADSMCQSMPSKNPGPLSQVWSQGGQCPKPYAQKPSYSQEGKRCEIKGDMIDPAPGGKTDCSGFFTGVEARLGHRLQPGKDITSPTTTAELVKLLSKGDSCYRLVSGELLPGDVVVYNDGEKGHVYKIDRISAGGPGSCEFSIIESSGGSDAQYGGPRVVVKGGESGGSAVSDSLGSNMKGMSKSCVAKDGKDVKVARFDDKKAGCKGSPKKFKNEDCVKSCPDLGRNSES